MGYLLQKSSTARPLLFLLLSSTDHITGKTGATPTVTISKAGGAFGAPGGAVTEVGNGWYKVAGSATDTATTGPLLLHATAAGADPCDDRYEVVAFNPDDSVALGLSKMPATIAVGDITGGAVPLPASGSMPETAKTATLATASQIAAAVLQTDLSTVENDAPADSLCTVCLATLHSSVADTTWTIRKTDGTTKATKTVTASADAEPITGVG